MIADIEQFPLKTWFFTWTTVFLKVFCISKATLSPYHFDLCINWYERLSKVARYYSFIEVGMLRLKRYKIAYLRRAMGKNDDGGYDITRFSHPDNVLDSGGA